ncbi:hypothetical protein NDO48_28535 [Aminobacter sp. MET-1]|nr:hypothetical protein [Aminobacter sp. MET-1]MCX8572989.1 hypothetical protein [Aminobacter sp. MET-1]
MAAAIMEQRRLGLIAKAMLTVPGHCLAQVAREFLALYPNARILAADETNFTKDKRARSPSSRIVCFSTRGRGWKVRRGRSINDFASARL